MSEEYIMDLLPEGHPVATISSEMTNVEEAARLTTTPGIIATLVEEAEKALEEDGGGPALAAILGQANTYLGAMNKHASDGFEEGEEWLEPHYESQDGSLEDNFEKTVIKHTRVLLQSNNTDIPLEKQEELAGRTTAAYILALSQALSEHVRMMSKGDVLSDGHRQAALGIHETLYSVLHHLDETEAESQENGPAARAVRAMESADQALHDAARTVTDLTIVQFHPSFEDDPPGRQKAAEMAQSTVDSMKITGLAIHGDQDGDPRETIQSFYHAGALHIKRMTDEYPQGFSKDQARSIASNIMLGTMEHAQDHAEGWGDTIVEFADNMAAEARAGAHTCSAQDVDLMLEALLEITDHPNLVRTAAHIMLGDAKTALRHLHRRRDLVQVASPDQAQAIMDAARNAGLTQGQLHYLQAFINGDTGRSTLPEGPYSRADTMRVLELAKNVSASVWRLTMLADIMGKWKEDTQVMDWVLENSDADDDDPDEDGEF